MGELLPSDRKKSSRISSYRAYPVSVDIKGDMRELLSPKSFYQQKPMTPSVLPRPYVPPSFRQTEINTNRGEEIDTEKMQTTRLQKTDVDIFNMNMAVAEVRNYGNQRTKPIERGNNKKSQKSLGLVKKVPRARNYVNDKIGPKVKLAPPPIGESVGHGIIQI